MARQRPRVTIGMLRISAMTVRTLLGVAGVLLSIVGFVLAAGGLLSTFNGSAFYVLMGLGLIVSGALIAKRQRAGAWTYTAVLGGTLVWALRDVNLGGSSMAVRLAGPAILLAMLTLLMPALCGWHPRRTLTVFTAVMVATIGLGILSSAGGPLAGSTAAITHILDAETKGGSQ